MGTVITRFCIVGGGAEEDSTLSAMLKNQIPTCFPRRKISAVGNWA